MAISRTLPALISSIRRRCFMKQDDPDFSDADITAMLNEQVGPYLSDLMRPFSQQYAVQTYDQTLVVDQQDYLIPPRAINGTIEAMGVVDSTGHVPGYRLVLYDLQDSVLLQTVAASIVPVAYSVPGNVVRVWPAPSSVPTSGQNTLRIQYMQRASELVDTTAVVTLASAPVDNGNGTYTVTATTTPPATFVSGAAVEFVKSTPGYSTLTPTAEISGVLGNAITVTGTLPGAPQAAAAGDYLCLYDQAPVLTNVPLEFQECLLQWVGLKMMEAKGDQGAMDRMGKALSVAEGNLRKQLSQRNTGQRRYLNAWSGFSGVPVRGLLWPLTQPGP